jgi:hypothetical protein
MLPAGSPLVICLVSALCISVTCTSSAAWADADPSDPLGSQRDTERWVPALGVYSSIGFHKIEGLVDSTRRGPTDDEDLDTHVRMEGHIELMSPALFSRLAKPRLFLRGGAGRAWDSRHDTAKEGDPGPAVIPEVPGNIPPPLAAVTGQGSSTRTQFKPYFYTLSGGLAFSFPLGEQTLRLKPSVEYRYTAVEIEGVITDVLSIDDSGNCPCSVGRLSTKEQNDLHFLGGGLEIELDTVRTGPFLVSIFTSAQAYRTLSGRKLRTRASGFFDDGVTPIDVSSRVFLDEWSFSGGVGVRLRWLPE